MNCTNCGSNLPDNAKFCSICGSPITTPSVIAEQTIPVEAVYQQTTEQALHQPPVQNQSVYQQTSEQALYQPPVQNQSVYQQTSEQALYQPPVQNQSVYQQTTTQALYQSPNQTIYGQAVYGQPVSPKKKSKAPWIALGVSLFLLAAIVAIVVVLLVSCSGADKRSPNAVINSFMTSIIEEDADDCLDTIYPCMMSTLTSLGHDEDDIFYMLKSDTLSPFQSAVTGFSNLKVTETEQMSSEDLTRYNSTMSSMKDYIFMTAGLELRGTVQVSLSGVTTPSEHEWRATVVCADGEYYILDFHLYSDY